MVTLRHPTARSLPATAAFAAVLAIGGAAEARQERVAARPTLKTGTADRAQPARPAEQPVMAVISIGDQRISVYGADGLIKRAPVSTGKPGHPTPTGVFSVIQKNRWHRSNIYSGAPMPFMQRLTWSGIAIHEGSLPGYPASHGCVRLPGGFARELFSTTKMGMRVIVTFSDATPEPFSHQGLPEPLLVPASTEAQRIASAGGAVVMPAALLSSPERLLNPIERGRLAKLEAQDAVQRAAKAVEEALSAAAFKAAAANRNSQAVEDATGAVADAEAQLRTAIAAKLAASGDAQAAAAERVQDAEDHLAEALRVQAEATREADAALPASFEAVKAVRAAEAAHEAAQAALKDASRRTEHVSVLVSRKERRVFVRQGFTPVFDEPIEIRDPDLPLGTHLLLAAQTRDEGRGLEWLSTTVPDSSLGLDDRSSRKTRGEVARPAVPTGTLTAAAALERIEWPAQTRRLIAERLWAGGSIVISDHGLGNETGLGTDFIVQTR